MPTDDTGAYQELAARLREVVALPTIASVLGYVPEVRYADVNYGNKEPPPNKAWIKFGVVQAGEKSRTLGNPARVTYHGVANVQLFIPVSDTNGAERGRLVAAILLQGLQKATANVNLYKQGVKDMPVASSWFYKRIFATYSYAQYLEH